MGPFDDLRKAVAKAIDQDLQRLGLRASDYCPHEDDQILRHLQCAVLSLIKFPVHLISTVHQSIFPPRSLPPPIVPETDAACASCGETAYSVRWSCMSCTIRPWHVCGTCVDTKGSAALCKG